MEANADQYKSEEEAEAARVFDDQEGYNAKHKKIKVFLTRHGQAAHNVAEVQYFAGGSLEQDSPLAERGIESAEKVAEVLKNEGVEVLVSSDLQRSKQTAEVIAAKLGFPVDMVELEGLREVHVGELTGKTREQVRTEGSQEAKEALEVFLAGDIRKIKFPGGETYEVVCQRVRESLEMLIKEHGDKAKIAIVGHGIVNKVILSLMFPDQIDFINQLDLSHDEVVEFDTIIDQQNKPDFKNIKFHSEKG